MDDSQAQEVPEAPEASTSTLNTLRTVEFRLGLKGYNVDEVDEYLDKAAQEAEGLQEHVRRLNDRLRQADERVARLEREKVEWEKRPATVAVDRQEHAAVATNGASSDETLQRTLVLAQKFVDQTKRDAEAEAAALMAQADEKARTKVATAEQKARQMEVESQKKLREDVARLEATRTELASDVETMARHLESERNRLRGAISDILKWVDEHVQPANSLVGVKSKPGVGEKGNDAQGRSVGGSEAARGGDPTLSRQDGSGAAVSGADHSR